MAGKNNGSNKSANKKPASGVDQHKPDNAKAGLDEQKSGSSGELQQQPGNENSQLNAEQQNQPGDDQQNNPGGESQQPGNENSELDLQQQNNSDADQQNNLNNELQQTNVAYELKAEKRYKVNRDLLEHDGEQYGMDDPISIPDDKQRDALLKLGAIVPAGVALLVGGVTATGEVVELHEMEFEVLQKLGADMGINHAEKLNKEALIEAITSAELELIDAEQTDDETTE